MAEDKSKDSEKKPSYLPIAGALFLGIVVGAALGSGDEAALKVKRDLEERVSAAEQQLSAAESRVEEAVAAAQEATASAADQAASATSEQLGALEQKLSEVENAVAGAGDSEEVAAIRNRVNVLAQQMAEAIASAQRSGDGDGAPAAPAEDEAAAPAEEAAPPEGDAAPAEGEAAPAEDSTDAAAPAEESTDEAAAAPEGETETAAAPSTGDDGLVLAVGQTGTVQGARVFLSRLDEESGEARVMIVGEGPATLSAEGEPIAIGEGCSMTLVGVQERRAYLGVACGE